MGLPGERPDGMRLAREQLGSMKDGPYSNVLRLVLDIETGNAKQAEAAKRGFAQLGKDALVPLCAVASYAGFFSTVSAMTVIDPAEAVRVAESRCVEGRGIVEAHLLARLAMAQAPGALDALRRMAHLGDGITSPEVYVDGDLWVRQSAGLWLLARFGEPDASEARTFDENGSIGRLWAAQDRPVATWKRCPSCRARLPRKRALVRAVQCERCGQIFAEPSYEPVVSHEPRSWGRLVGLKEWRPMTEGQFEYWGQTKEWVVSAPEWAPMYGDTLMMPMLEDVPDENGEA